MKFRKNFRTSIRLTLLNIKPGAESLSLTGAMSRKGTAVFLPEGNRIWTKHARFHPLDEWVLLRRTIHTSIQKNRSRQAQAGCNWNTEWNSTYEVEHSFMTCLVIVAMHSRERMGCTFPGVRYTTGEILFRKFPLYSWCLYSSGLQTTAREAISSGPRRHFVNNGKMIYLRKACWCSRM